MEICENIKISIIVPIYNASKYLDKCVTSIISQTYKNIDILLIDDGSKDNSLDICKSFATKDKRIRVMHHKNQGLVYTRKIGICESVGEYFTFVDADDYIEKDMVNTIVGELQKYKPDIIAYGLVEDYGNYVISKKNKFPCGMYERKELCDVIFPEMLSYGKFFDFGLLPNLVCKYIRKDFWDSVEIEVSDNVSIGEDADFSFQMIIQANTLQLMENYGYHYCKHSQSMMADTIEMDCIDSLYYDLLSRFENTGMISIMDKQLCDYINFVKLLKLPSSIDYIKKVFGEYHQIALYGAGGFGESIMSQYVDKISYWVDRNYQSMVPDNKKVQSCDILYRCQEYYDCIFIAILNTVTCERIKRELVTNGIEKEIIFFGM